MWSKASPVNRNMVDLYSGQFNYLIAVLLRISPGICTHRHSNPSSLQDVCPENLA